MRLLSAVLVCVAVAAAVADESNARFLAWLAENGASHAAVAVKDFDQYGKGLLAMQSIKHGDMLMDIPAKIIISRETLSSAGQRLPYVTPELLRNVQNDEDVIAIVLAREKLRGDESPWKPYLDVLPSYIPQPVLFSLRELAELQHPAMQSRVAEMQRVLHQRGATVAKYIQEHSEPVTSQEALELYKWGMSLVQSRALTFRGRKYLCPLADMFNYEPRNDKREANAGESFLRYHQLSSDGLQIFADRDCAAGVQLFEDYGDNKDDIYFLYHGFIPSTNPFRCLSIPVDLDHISGHPDKLRFLRMLGFHGRPNLCVDQHGDGLLAAAAIMMTNQLTGYETSDCADALKGTNLDEQVQIKQFLHDGDCSSPGFQLLKKHSGGKRGRCPLTAALHLRCRGDADAWAKRKRAGHLASESVTQLTRVMMIDAGSFKTDLETDRSMLAEVQENLSRTAITSAEFRRAANMQLALQYRMLRKQLHNMVADQIRQLHPELPLAQLPSLEERVDQLNEWLSTVRPAKNVLQAAADPTYRVSAVATKPIKTGEVYLSMPVHAIMDSDAANADPQFASIPAYLQKQFGRRDGYHELLLFLLHEYFIRRTDSKWWPYLQMLPTAEELLNPLLFNQTALQWVKPSVLYDQAVSYQSRVARSYQNLQRLRSLTHFLPPHILSFENYRWATAILDSRSIWWQGRRHLVPLLDTINCKEGPPGSKVHSTALSSNGKFAETRATWDFKAGEQVFENYGQPNHIYFLYHGFVLQENSHDCVLIYVELEEELLRDYPKIYEEHKEVLHALQYSKSRITACLKHPLPIEFIQFMQMKHLLETTQVCEHACALENIIATLQKIIGRYEKAAVTATASKPANVVQLHAAEMAHLKSIVTKLQQRKDSSGPFSEL